VNVGERGNMGKGREKDRRTMTEGKGTSNKILSTLEDINTMRKYIKVLCHQKHVEWGVQDSETKKQQLTLMDKWIN
jgi:hypothetical protein